MIALGQSRGVFYNVVDEISKVCRLNFKHPVVFVQNRETTVCVCVCGVVCACVCGVCVVLCAHVCGVVCACVWCVCVCVCTCKCIAWE